MPTDRQWRSRIVGHGDVGPDEHADPKAPAAPLIRVSAERDEDLRAWVRRRCGRA